MYETESYQKVMLVVCCQHESVIPFSERSVPNELFQVFIYLFVCFPK